MVFRAVNFPYPPRTCGKHIRTSAAEADFFSSFIAGLKACSTPVLILRLVTSSNRLSRFPGCTQIEPSRSRLGELACLLCERNFCVPQATCRLDECKISAERSQDNG